MQYWIGCSGWQYPEWKGLFYPEDIPKNQWLAYYATQFTTVEINNTFYGFPSEQTVQRWKTATPDNFRLSLKANRSITHYHRFNHTQTIINDFYKLADVLQEKLGCILFQLPKKLTYNLEFLNKVIAQLSASHTNVLEFQDESWWRDDVIELLINHNIVFANINSPIIQQTYHYTGKISYLRFHGKKEWYQGLYGSAYLRKWVQAIKKKPPRELWCYFDNTADVSAPKDALTWQQLIT